MPSIPPWLDISPGSFVQAREAGVRTGLQNAQLAQQGGLERARLGQERDLEGARISQQAQEASNQASLGAARIMQSAAEAAQQLAFEKQKLEAGQKQAAMEFQAGQETAKQNFMVNQTKEAVQNAYRQAQIGLGQQRIDQTAQQLKQAAQIATAKAAAAVPKPDPIAMNQFQTLQSAYLNSVREFHSATSKGDTNSAAYFKKDAEDYKNRADKLAETIRGQQTPVGAYNAATQTGTGPPPVTDNGQPAPPNYASQPAGFGSRQIAAPPVGGMAPSGTTGFIGPNKTSIATPPVDSGDQAAAGPAPVGANYQAPPAEASPAPAAPASGAGTKVKDKATGKTFIYTGDPKDIPADQYEILE